MEQKKKSEYGIGFRLGVLLVIVVIAVISGCVAGMYYDIDRGQMPIEGAGLKLVAGGDNDYTDSEINTNDGVPELTAGINVSDNKVVVIVDNDFFEKYPNGVIKMLSAENGGKPGYIGKKEFGEVAPGIFSMGMPIDGNNYMGFFGKSDINSPEEKDTPKIVYERK